MYTTGSKVYIYMRIKVFHLNKERGVIAFMKTDARVGRILKYGDSI